MAKGITDLTDEFDTRLGALEKSRAPKHEVDAAIAVYERMRSARAICRSLLTDSYADAAVVAVLAEISAEVHRLQGSNSAE